MYLQDLAQWLNWLIFCLQVLVSHIGAGLCPGCSTSHPAPGLRPEKVTFNLFILGMSPDPGSPVLEQFLIIPITYCFIINWKLSFSSLWFIVIVVIYGLSWAAFINCCNSQKYSDDSIFLCDFYLNVKHIYIDSAIMLSFLFICQWLLVTLICLLFHKWLCYYKCPDKGWCFGRMHPF